jgi:hypothetical protein
MTTATAILRDAFERVHEELPSIVDGMSPEELLWRPDPDANPLAWLVWHLARVQDDHLAAIADLEQVWTRGGWVDRFALPYPTEALGYGQTSDEVGAFTVSDPVTLIGYHAAVHDFTVRILDREDERTLERVVDRRWDPPVTAAARLVSVVGDITQHLGQAAYLRGLVERRR